LPSILGIKENSLQFPACPQLRLKKYAGIMMVIV
jgi:hypothetical protein